VRLFRLIAAARRTPPQPAATAEKGASVRNHCSPQRRKKNDVNLTNLSPLLLFLNFIFTLVRLRKKRLRECG
jgi:hypothetical protein